MVTLAGRPAARLRVLILAVVSAVLAALVAVGTARPGGRPVAPRPHGASWPRARPPGPGCGPATSSCRASPSCRAGSGRPILPAGSARPDVDWSISPVGLSAGGYNNHIFWDAETWMYPALLAQHPAEASTVVDYRFRTRAGARRNAERTGYGGMRFAWESALTGDEVTPTWAETGTTRSTPTPPPS